MIADQTRLYNAYDTEVRGVLNAQGVRVGGIEGRIRAAQGGPAVQVNDDNNLAPPNGNALAVHPVGMQGGDPVARDLLSVKDRIG